MNPLYELKNGEKGLIVEEFNKGKRNYLTLDDYISKGNDIKPLFDDYFSKNPSAKDDLRFEDSKPGFCKVVYGDIVLEEISVKDIKIKVSNRDTLLGVDYSQILRNTKQYEDEKKRLEEESKIVNKLESIVKDENFIQRHKGLVSLIGCVVVGISATLGYILTNSSGSNGYTDDDYNKGYVSSSLSDLRSPQTASKTFRFTKSDKLLLFLKFISY